MGSCTPPSHFCLGLNFTKGKAADVAHVSSYTLHKCHDEAWSPTIKSCEVLSFHVNAPIASFAMHCSGFSVDLYVIIIIGKYSSLEPSKTLKSIGCDKMSD